MIDCTKTENQLTVKLRLCEIGCYYCPLSFVNNDKKISCEKFETQYHQRAIELIQQWSDEHPSKTYLSELLKVFPNSSLDENGTPIFCPHHLEFMSIDNCRNDGNCIKCWNQSIKNDKE